MTDEDNKQGLLHEFSRRLRHQLGMQKVHDEGCTQGPGCPTERLISCGLSDSWTTLAGIGCAREANDIMHEDDDDDIRTKPPIYD